MDKIFFATAFKPNRQNRSIMEKRDNVNRVSYVDATIYVQRMIMEGRNLNEYRAKVLRSGLYGPDDSLNDESVPPMPVYDTDPVIQAETTKLYVDALNDSLKSKQPVKTDDSASVPVEDKEAETTE